MTMRMQAMPARTPHHDRGGLGFWDKGLVATVWVASGALFMSIGWDVFSPADPGGAVSLLVSDRSLVVWAELAALVVVVSALATIAVGRLLPDAGVFAGMIGLAALALRGGTSRFLLLEHASGPSVARVGLSLALILETLGWAVILLLSMVASALVSRWFFGGGRSAPAGQGSAREVNPPPSAWSLPRVGPWMARGLDGGGAPAAPRQGLRHTAFVAIAMLAALSVLYLDSEHRPVLHGQVCFAVAAAGWIGSYLGFRMFPVRTAFWSLLAVPVVAIAAYLWAAFVPVSAALPINVPASAMLRPLPIQYVSVGAAGILAAYWFVQPFAGGAATAGHERHRSRHRGGAS